MLITANDIYDYLTCPHRVYLNSHENPDKRKPLAQFLDLLFRRGVLHEDKILEGLEYTQPKGFTSEERFKSTLELMWAGEDLIYQGVLMAGDEQGIPDLLRKVGTQSKLGQHSYMPIDIKSGKGYESGSSVAVKKTYGIQLAFYARLLQVIQGVYPQEAIVINVNGEEIPFGPGEFRRDLEEILPYIRALVAGQDRDEPARIGECAVCGWHDLCLERLTASSDVTLVVGVGRSYKSALKQAGIGRVEDVTTLDKKKAKIKGVGDKRATTWSRQARVYVSDTLEVLDRTPIPTSSMRIYFDFEDDPLQDLIYLYGFLTVPQEGDSQYSFIWCDDREGEERAFDDFLGLCRSLSGQDYLVYHYHRHEQTVIDRLSKKYPPNDPESLEEFRSKMVDLQKQVESHVVLPILGYGLKPVSKFIGFRYSDEDPGGAQSIAWFQDYQQDREKNAELRQRILTYNREDCEATKLVHEWLNDLNKKA
ncbi:MAG: TM0106 family RecB-like putative nuclease [Acidobacteria bacterium]|nr:TM0106 family RecB-like putative nuclease [Acidobacteriota bacterium]